MILTSHLIVGAAIGSKISNPLLALLLALFSHYFLDSLPHKDYLIPNIQQKQWNKSFFDFFKIFLDVFLGILLISLFSDNNPIIWAAAFLAIIPDGITLLGRILPRNKLIIQHQKVHVAANMIGDSQINKKIPAFWGVISQIAVIVVAIFLL